MQIRQHITQHTNQSKLTRLTNSGIVYLKGREISFQKSFPETVEKQHKH